MANLRMTAIRMAIFAVLGPLIGTIALFPPLLVVLPLIVPFSYLMGIGPALATGVMDEIFARHGMPRAPRTLASGAVGAVTSTILGLSMTPSDVYPWLFFVGLVTGAVCSLLVPQPDRAPSPAGFE